jgi:lipopolysaccharide/colanic/teichoic acid biosynthesis glycosyltransferase
MPPASVRLVKRTLDVAGAVAGLGLTAPLFPLIAVAIRLDSPGPILFRQKRVRGLRPSQRGETSRFLEFDMLKFRTMRADAEAKSGAVFSTAKDSRVTRVGKLLRRTRLDELPQFINVLRGEMSIVGPRPERAEFMDRLMMAIPFFEERLRDVKPGITGLAQIRLNYTGAIPDGSELAPFRETLENPFGFREAKGAMADGLRAKLIYDVAYTASLERLSSYVRMEVEILMHTPWVMLRGTRY